ncbi:MAG: hypothetical protein M1837_005446 [Sclerophora amabilis]|nr:MAG: hypothetical protein M1837_005446 [Sclerophora amabilis]
MPLTALTICEHLLDGNSRVQTLQRGSNENPTEYCFGKDASGKSITLFRRSDDADRAVAKLYVYPGTTRLEALEQDSVWLTPNLDLPDASPATPLLASSVGRREVLQLRSNDTFVIERSKFTFEARAHVARVQVGSSPPPEISDVAGLGGTERAGLYGKDGHERNGGKIRQPGLLVETSMTENVGPDLIRRASIGRDQQTSTPRGSLGGQNERVLETPALTTRHKDPGQGTNESRRNSLRSKGFTVDGEHSLGFHGSENDGHADGQEVDIAAETSVPREGKSTGGVVSTARVLSAEDSRDRRGQVVAPSRGPYQEPETKRSHDADSKGPSGANVYSDAHDEAIFHKNDSQQTGAAPVRKGKTRRKVVDSQDSDAISKDRAPNPKTALQNKSPNAALILATKSVKENKSKSVQADADLCPIKSIDVHPTVDTRKSSKEGDNKPVGHELLEKDPRDAEDKSEAITITQSSVPPSAAEVVDDRSETTTKPLGKRKRSRANGRPSVAASPKKQRRSPSKEPGLSSLNIEPLSTADLSHSSASKGTQWTFTADSSNESLKTPRRTRTKPLTRIKPEKPSPPRSGPPRICFSNSAIAEQPKMTRFLKSQGVKIVDAVTATGCDLLCVGDGELKRTSKLTLSVALGKPIVTDNWVTDSQRAGRLLDVTTTTAAAATYLPQDPQRETAWGIDLAASISRGVSGIKVLRGYTVGLTPTLAKDLGPAAKELEHIISTAGADSVVPTTRLPPPPDPAEHPPHPPNKNNNNDNNTLILASEHDPDAAALANSGWTTLYTKDLISLSILRGRLETDTDEFRIRPASLPSSPPPLLSQGHPAAAVAGGATALGGGGGGNGNGGGRAVRRRTAAP